MSQSWIACVNAACPARRHVLGSEAQRECAALALPRGGDSFAIDLRTPALATFVAEGESRFGDVFAVVTDRYGSWVTVELDHEGGQSAQVQLQWSATGSPTALDVLRHLDELAHSDGFDAGLARLQLQELLGEDWQQTIGQSTASAGLGLTSSGR